MVNLDIDENGGKVTLVGKVAKFPRNTKASKAYDFLENIKISRNKLWYFIIEKEITSAVDGGSVQELQVIKYNNNNGYDCKAFLDKLGDHYKGNSIMTEHVSHLKIDGNDKFSIIRNIPDIMIGDKKLITILSTDLVNLLYL